MLPVVASTLRENDLLLGHYAEPYAGGCGLALSLMYGGFVSDIHINDIDLGVWSFWHAVLNETNSIIELIKTTPITIDEWYRQKEILRSEKKHDPTTLGFATFFLNRTNRSGVISTGGVIGGLNQKGNYLIDCRFNREELSRRVKRISSHKSRIHLSSMDAVDFINGLDISLPERSLFFIDPPYFGKGRELYTNFYRPNDHVALAERLGNVGRPWLLTYDYVPEIKLLYSEHQSFRFNINYSLNQKRLGNELLVASPDIRIPVGSDAGHLWPVREPDQRIPLI